MPDSIKVSAVFPVSAKRLYQAWLSSREHSAFTGAKAAIEPKIGRSFTAWGGYIQGKTLELEPYQRIVQSWRTSEFPEKSKDSKIEVIFEEAGAKDKIKTKITIKHTDIPEGQGEDYRQGWFDYYFKPMKEYFANK